MERGGDGISSNRVRAGWRDGEDMDLAAPDERWWTRQIRGAQAAWLPLEPAAMGRRRDPGGRGKRLVLSGVMDMSPTALTGYVLTELPRSLDSHTCVM
jgi:hypothetical protein